jgi:ribosomal protein S14
MLIKTETTLSLRCPDCGRPALQTVSRFTFGREGLREVLCSCGSLLLVVNSKSRKSYWLEINCVICEADHMYRLTPRELWSRDVVHLSCQETGLELGCIGPYERVRAYLQTKEQALEVLVEEMGGPDYFRNAEVMLSALTHVHTLAEEGSLSCPCGENCIEMEIFTDRVELHCRHCLRLYVLAAAAEQDLVGLERYSSIELTRRVFGGKKEKGSPPQG